MIRKTENGSHSRVEPGRESICACTFHLTHCMPRYLSRPVSASRVPVPVVSRARNCASRAFSFHRYYRMVMARHLRQNRTGRKCRTTVPSRDKFEGSLSQVFIWILYY
jgi:hypothetical protein